MKKLLLLLVLVFACLFTVTACGGDDEDSSTPVETPTEQPTESNPEQDLANAISYLKQYYASESSVTASNYELISAVPGAKITWTATVTSGDQNGVSISSEVNANGRYTVTVAVEPVAAIEYTLTATVTIEAGLSGTVEYQRTIPAFEVLSYAAYAAAKVDDPLVVQGIVTAILSKDHYGDKTSEVYLHTPEGGFYVYNLTNDPVDAGIKVGMTVRATGVKASYNGTHEVVNATLQIVDSTIKEVTPVDLTDAYLAASDLQAAELVYAQARLVTLKGVTITGAGDNGYYKFKLGSLESYVRISSSTCPLNPADTDAFVAAYNQHIGWEANVTGVVSIYNGNFYLQPVTVDAIEYLQLPQKSDAEKVAHEKDSLALDTTKFSHGATVTLPAAGSTYTDVAISWVSETPEVVIADGVATVTLAGVSVNAKLVATLTLNGETVTKTVEFEISAEPAVVNTTIAELTTNKPTKDGEVIYVVTGTWSAKDGMAASSNTYGNGFLTDEAGNKVTIYGLCGSRSVLTYADGKYTYKNAKDFPSLGIEEGAVITVGMVYTVQYDNYSAYLIEIKPAEPAVVNTTIAELVAAAPETDAAVIYVVTGTWSAKDGMAASSNTYGNGFLTDEAGNKVTIYGLCGSRSVLTYADGKYTYKNAKDFPSLGIEEGMTIKVGMVYTVQYKNYSAYLIEVVENGGDTPTPTPTPTPDGEPAVIETTVSALAANKPTANLAQIYVVTATWSAKDGLAPSANTYGNGFLTDTDGSKVTIYGLCSNSSVLTYADGVYTYKNSKDFPSMNLVDGSVIKVAMVYTVQYNNYSAYLIEVVQGVSAEDAVENDKAALELPESTSSDLTLPTTGAAGTTITWESSNEAVIATDGKITRPAAGEADVVVTLTATVSKDGAQATATFTVTVKAEVASTGEVKTVSYDFVSTFSTYASGWDTTYTKRVIKSSQLGEGLHEATFTLSNANKQSQTITDRPVSASKSSAAQYITVEITDGSIQAVTFNLKEWSSSKKFKDIVVEYFDGTNWVACSTVSGSGIAIPAQVSNTSDIPAGVTQVRLSFTGNSTSNNQIGLTSIDLTIAQ